MKLLFITEFFPSKDLKFTGGVESYIFYLIKELSRTHQITVICRKLNKSSGDSFNHNIKLIRINALSSRVDSGFLTIPSRLYFTIYALIKGLTLEFDIVVGTNFVTHPSAFLIGFFKRRPKVAWYPDVFIGKWFKLTNFFSATIGELTERISINLPWNAVISLSISTVEKLLKYGIKKDSITTIYAGVDKSFFSLSVKKEKIFTIISIARLVGYKRVDLLIKSAKILKSKDINFSWQIIGEGPLKDKLINLIKKLNLEDKVKIESNLKRSELIKKLKNSHLFCSSSEEEGFGMAVIEAGASRVPFVITDIPVFKEITRGEGGLFFKKGSASDLAKKIQNLIKDENLRTFLENKAHELSKIYNWSNIAKEFEVVFKDLLINEQSSSTNKIILMVIDAWFPHVGGGQIHVWELAKKLNKLGFEVNILTRNNGVWIDSVKGMEVKRVGFIKSFSNLFGRIEFLVRALFIILFSKYDLLHLFAFSPGLLSPIIKFFKIQPVVFTILGEGIKISGFAMGANFLQDLVFYKIPYDLEITVAKNIIKKKISSKKLVFISNGVEVENFIKAQRLRRKVKKIVCIARLFFDKGVDLGIDAFKILNRKDLKLIIVGDGPEEKKLKSLAKNEKNIEFRGTVYGDSYIQLLEEADLMLIPSRTEGLPLRLLEAWSAKLPVIGTDAGDISRYIQNGKNGFLTKIDAKSIAQGIDEAIRSKKLNEITDNAFNIVQQYSWENIAKQTAKEYLNLLNEKP